MDEELIHEYLRRFDKAFSLLKNDRGYTILYIDLTEEDLRQHQEEYANGMLHDGSVDQDVFSSAAMIFYGFRLGAVRLKGRNECFTRQGGYMDNAIRKYNLDEILDEETEEDNPDAVASHIIEWATNPGSNVDVSEAVLERMIVPLVKNLCKATPPGKRKECTVILPPISKNIDIQDWSVLFSSLKANDLRINVENYGCLCNIQSGERHYIVQYQTDGYREYVIISAYEMIRGHNACLGSLAFDVYDSDRQYILNDVKPVSFNIDNQENKYEKKEEKEIHVEWGYVDCKFPVNSGFNSFLGSHAESFGKEMYKWSGEEDLTHSETNILKKVFNRNEALQAVEVCARIIGENNLYNIALGDLVYIANALQRNKGFKKVLLGTSNRISLGTYKQFASDIDLSRLHQIPSNFNSFGWKIRDKRISVVPYFNLDAKKHGEKQIVESVISHFDHCSTARVAEELLYLFKSGEDPSAFFVAKVFLYLSQLDSIEIESRNEIVTSIENVDNIEYHEIDKSKIRIQNGSNKKVHKSGVFKQRQIISPEMNESIDVLQLTVRAHNCLQRAGIKKIGDLVKLSREELSKVRNLKEREQELIMKNIHRRGLKMADE